MARYPEAGAVKKRLVPFVLAEGYSGAIPFECNLVIANGGVVMVTFVPDFVSTDVAAVNRHVTVVHARPLRARHRVGVPVHPRAVADAIKAREVRRSFRRGNDVVGRNRVIRVRQ